MLFQNDIEQRIKVVLSDPGNQSCSECDRDDNTPVYAAFVVTPSDHKALGVVCCKKCSKLFTKVQGADFVVKKLDDLSDWSKDDVEALELGGNKLVNLCYEGKITKEAMKEKEKRETKKYGYEAFFFEKHVNLTYFDEIVYKNRIHQSSKALVEKRFNMSLRSFNLKKTAAAEAEAEKDDVLCFSDEEDEEDTGNHDSGEVSFSSQEEEQGASPQSRANRKGNLSKAHSENRLVSRRQVSGRRVRSARNIVEEDGEARATNTEGRERRRVSTRRINHGSGGEEARPRRQSNRRVPTGGEEEARPRRQSNRRLSGRSLVVDSPQGGSSETRRKSTGRSPLRATGSGSERRESGGVQRKSSSRRVEGGEGQRSPARSSGHREHQ